MRYRVLTPEMMNRLHELKDIRRKEIAVREREKKIFTWDGSSDDINAIEWSLFQWADAFPRLYGQVMRYKSMTDKETKELARQVAKTNYIAAYNVLKNKWRIDQVMKSK